MYEEVNFRNCNLNSFGRFDPGDLDLWPSDSKMYRVPLIFRMNVWTKFEEGRSRHSWVIEQKQFWNIWPWWPLTPKSIGFLCCPGRTCGSFRKVHHGVLQLLFGNEKVTDGETDRHVQSNMPPSPSKGGIKIHNILPSSNSQIINSVEVRSQYSRVSKDLVSEGVHSCQHNADICSCHPFLENTRIKVKITPSSSQIWWI